MRGPRSLLGLALVISLPAFRAAPAADCSVELCFRRGDVNADGRVDLSDVDSILRYFFAGLPTAPGCLETLDLLDNNAPGLTSAIYLLNYLYLGGSPPAAPFPDCGPPDPLDPCGQYPAEACGAALPPERRSAIELSFFVPPVLEGEPGSTVSGTVLVRLDDSRADVAEKVTGWSLSVRSGDPSLLAITDATVHGTASQSNGSGLLTTGAGNEGAVAHGLAPPMMDPGLVREESPHDLLKLTVEGTAPLDGGCVACTLEFHDGLLLGGTRIENFISSLGQRLRPSSRPATVQLCSGVAELRPGEPPLEIDLSPTGRKLLRLSAA